MSDYPNIKAAANSLNKALRPAREVLRNRKAIDAEELRETLRMLVTAGEFAADILNDQVERWERD